jgi:ABC-type uncharacterized transport system ATPase subunit
MDPISRRQVWKIIEEAKVGRAIVLTTHSMEESDFLSDRISIMARGRMRCIGSSISLKNRFGAGIRVSISCASGNYSPAVAFFNSSLQVAPETVAPSGITFIIPQVPSLVRTRTRAPASACVCSFPPVGPQLHPA